VKGKGEGEKEGEEGEEGEEGRGGRGGRGWERRERMGEEGEEGEDGRVGNRVGKSNPQCWLYQQNPALSETAGCDFDLIL